MKNKIRTELITNGISALQHFGYPSVNEQNILTDLLYSQFFSRMLKSTLFDITELTNHPDKQLYIDVIGELQTEIQQTFDDELNYDK